MIVVSGGRIVARVRVGFVGVDGELARDRPGSRGGHDDGHRGGRSAGQVTQLGDEAAARNLLDGPLARGNGTRIAPGRLDRNG